MHSIAPLPVVVPLGTAALLLMFGTVLPDRAARALAIAAMLTETALAAALVRGARAGPVIYWFGGWTPRHGVAIGVSFAVDRLGAGAATFAGLIVTAAALTAAHSFKDRVALTHALMLTMLAAMAGFCLTGDIFNLFVFYELMAVSAFGLAAYSTAQVTSLRAALNFAITNSVGAFLFLIGIALLYGRTGALNLAQIGRDLAKSHVDGLVIVAITTITVGLLVKAAIVPFHFWLVDVASWGSLPLVVVLGGILDTLAVYALARVYWTVFAPALAAHDGSLRGILIVMGATTALVGAALSLIVRGARRVVAFVMVSHTGTLLVGIGCLTAFGIAGAAIYAVAGGAIKAAVVACVGELDDDRQPTRPLAGPIVLLALCGLALAGLPLFGTALGESVIERSGATIGDAWIAPALILASVFTGAAVLRIALAAARNREARLRAPAVAIVATMLVGLAIGARFALSRWVAGAAAAFVASTAYGRVVLNGAKFASPAAVRGVGLPTSGAVTDLIAVAVALGLVAWLDMLRPMTRRRTAELGGTTVGNAVRRLHNGSLGDSVAWVTVGATAIVVTLAMSMH